MKPLYNGQENHYKRMLDLQEKLRKSEEERIRLEERFNVLVQESQNRHQTCINKLRIGYGEYLEKQRARDERNNKLLGTLDKVDSSLALIIAKTERLNIIRKQYEAHLLRAYGNQLPNGSITADSGLGSQYDQDMSPSPIFSKSTQVTSKNVFPSANQEFASSNYKLTNTDNRTVRNLDSFQKPSELRNVNFKLCDDSPLLYENLSDIFKSRSVFSCNSDKFWKYSSTPKEEVERGDFSFKSFPVLKSTELSSPIKHDLDGYISTIKRLNEDLHQSREGYRKTERELERADEREYEREHNREHERDHSNEEADHEQNTSGDLLNVTLSEDGLEPTKEAVEETNRKSSRIHETPQAHATRSASRNAPMDYVENTAISKDRGNVLNGEGCVRTYPTLAAATDKFSQPEIAPQSSQRGIKMFAQHRLQQPFEESLTKLTLPNEPKPLIQQNQHHLAPDDTALTDSRDSPELDNSSDEESKNNGDDCIEDDYDDTVDIDSWMPDDLAQQSQELPQQDDIRDRPRRKLESIEEVEQPEDEDPDREAEAGLNPPAVPQGNEQKIQEFEKPRNLQDTSLKDNQELAENSSEVYNDNVANPSDQQYYEQDHNAMQEYHENSEYLQNYEQNQDEGQQEYQYSDDPNQQYAYGDNVQYSGYEDQQYIEGQYGGYMNEQYQHYNQNQPYEQDPGEEYQQYNSSHDYENYQFSNQHQEPLNNEESNQKQYESNKEYGYSQEEQAYTDGDVNQSDETNKTENLTIKDGREQIANNYSQGQISEETDIGAQATKNDSKDNKTKKDVIKSILDSDSESFIERNLSNTESDFDFN